MPQTIELKLIAVLGAFLAFLGIVAAYEVEKANVQKLTAELRSSEQANHDDEGVIVGMRQALALWQDAVAKSALAEATAKGVLEAQAAAHVESAQKLTSMEKSDDAIPGCADVLRVDLATFCPGYVAAIRVRSTGSDLQGTFGKGPRPAGDAPKP